MNFLINGKEFDLFNKSYTMGILNITPDSFSDGGKYIKTEEALKRALNIINEGADIIDIGAESSRPGATPVSEEEELNRIIPVLNLLKGNVDIPISIDTYKSKVAEESIKRGATIINDIYGFKKDKDMAKVVADTGVYCVLMHMRRDPNNMHENPKYKNVLVEVINELEESIEIALKCGVKKEKIILDPGIGFAKDFNHNLELLKKIEEFKKLGYPLLLGVSRKRFIGEILGTEPSDRLEGSLAVASYIASSTPAILRVHDVKETSKTLKIINAINGFRE
ncbi:MAG: dihydropteroate synthase [Fusobacteriaceae bacterium]|nr:dihydropteroate synthase [Fusobacteriaceae bacterium]MBN2838271.1 dihydropteroate synthase [Fusobacteriaceae bacterium]